MYAAIVIDNYKLTIFKTMLEKKGFKFVELNGPKNDLTTLNVTINNIEELMPLVRKMVLIV